jgi:hypothetical protein
LGLVPTTFYKTEAEAFKHSSELENIATLISAKESEVDPYHDQLTEYANNPDSYTWISLEEEHATINKKQILD